MKKEIMKMTTSQFAKLHGVNKRTLHYYDNIGLFSPQYKGENNYRYYDYSQSMEFEYIRMLKELHMGIEEIKAYINNPNEADFIRIAEEKVREINQDIQRLKKSKNILQDKMKKLETCRRLKKREVQLVVCEEEHYLTIPFDFRDNDMPDLMSHVKETWSADQYRMGIGSFIAVDKIQDGNFETYDGLFTLAPKNSKNFDILIKPKGTYVCGYQRGQWEELPDLYSQILKFAEKNGLKLTGYAFEIGINDFAISDRIDYVTQILIKTEPRNS